MKCCILMCACLDSFTSAAELTVGLDGRVSTLSSARDTVREMRASREIGNIDVIIQDGIYRLDEILVFGPEDSAPAGAITRYRAADGLSLDPDQLEEQVAASPKNPAKKAPTKQNKLDL